MSLSYDEARAAMRDAQSTMKAADEVAGDIASILIGRLRCVNKSGYGGTSTLRSLKRELRDFDMTTGRWKR